MSNDNIRFIVHSSVAAPLGYGYPDFWMRSFTQNSLKADLTSLNEEKWVDAQRFFWVTRSTGVADSSLEAIMNGALVTSDNRSAVRIVAHHSAVLSDAVFPDGLPPNLVSIELLPDGAAGRWVNGDGHISSHIQVNRRNIKRLILDLARDVAIANSTSYRDIINLAVRKLGYAWVCRQKAEFALAEGLTSIHGEIQSDAGYVSFASMYENWKDSVELWDHFLLSKLAEFVPLTAGALDGVMKWRPHVRTDNGGTKGSIGIGGQISRSKLYSNFEDRISEPGAYLLLILAQRASNVNSSLGERLREVFHLRRDQGMTNRLQVFRIADFIGHTNRTKERVTAEEIRNWVKDSYVSALRFLIA